MQHRAIEATVQKILNEYKKMVFLSGPRQVGKTTVAKQFLKKSSQGQILNWDLGSDQKIILKNPYFFEQWDHIDKKPPLIVYDEIHKYRHWKNYLKGIYDKYGEHYRLLVTGSGRLDLYKKGGDSLLGRYFSVPLFPFTLGELSHQPISWLSFVKSLKSPTFQSNAAYSDLYHFGGFPEPFLKADSIFLNLWSQERKKRLVREDIRDASAIREISQLEALTLFLPSKIGSLLSINTLREDIQVAFETIRDWIHLLEQFYYLFIIRPFSGKLSGMLKKEPKIYLYDYTELKNEGQRFENMVALHLYSAICTWNASEGTKLDLRFVRDKSKREVDFLIIENQSPVCLIECKLSDKNVDPNLIYFQNKLKVPYAFQVVHEKKINRLIKNENNTIHIVSADAFLSLLP
jgi:predicted AAA+ superfamily ATPase